MVQEEGDKAAGTFRHIVAVPQNCTKRDHPVLYHVIPVPVLLKHILEDAGKTDSVISTLEFTWNSILPGRMTFNV